MTAVDEFLRKVLRSGLLDRKQLQSTLRTLPKDRRDQVPSIADHLVQQGKLTRFQAHKLLQGITVGLVLGSYQILVPLGRGGMGTVYLAMDTRTQKYVALKILPPRLARAEVRLLARFQREMELSKKVDHPQLARTMEAGAIQNIHYIAMEYIPGQTLYRLVMTQGPLSVARAAHLFSEVARALAHAHSQGLIHRDMKPSNIMVTPRDHAKVLDLGLAFTEGEEVEDVEIVGGKGYIVGSIDYMAPEQTRDPTNIDARADLYALGCCLYFALTGKPPFPSGTVHDKVKAHRHEQPELVHQKNPQVPEAFAALVQQLMSKDPAQRFSSAHEVETALDPWRAKDTEPPEEQGDAVFQRAIQQVIETWIAPEPARDAMEDAILFRINSEEKPPPSEFLSRSIFSEIDHYKLHLGILVAVIFWIGLLLFCGVASFLFTFAR